MDTPHPLPTIGRSVHYMLSAQDAEQIDRRRTSSGAIHERIKDGTWPIGAQAHIGNHASEGQVVPMTIVVVWNVDGAVEGGVVNGQAILDGNDTLWVTSAHFSFEPTPGCWSWPPRG